MLAANLMKLFLFVCLFGWLVKKICEISIEHDMSNRSSILNVWDVFDCIASNCLLAIPVFKVSVVALACTLK